MKKQINAKKNLYMIVLLVYERALMDFPFVRVFTSRVKLI